MNKIIEKEILSKNMVRLEVEALHIVEKYQAGHFVMVKIHEENELIPVLISGTNPITGTINLVMQSKGTNTAQLAALNEDEEINTILGPFGKTSTIKNVGTVLCCASDDGIAPLLPIVKELYAAGNKVITIIAGKNKDQIILEKEINACSFETFVITDDDTNTNKQITQHIESVLKNETINQAFFVGSLMMIKNTSAITKKYKVPALANFNTLMIDGTSICGICRLTKGTLDIDAVCDNCPEFDAHKINYDDMLKQISKNNVFDYFSKTYIQETINQ